MTSDIHIIAVGARTPLGLDAESSVAAVRAGITQVNEHTFLVDQMMEPVRMSLDSELDPGQLGSDRLTVLAAAALKEVSLKLQLEKEKIRKIPLFLGLPEDRPGFSGQDQQAIKNGMNQSAIPVDFEPFEIFPCGHASGLVALDAACQLIRAGKAEVCVVAGVDSYLDLKTIEWLDENKQLATSYNRGAFFPGEGAGSVVVCSESFVERSGMDSWAVVRGIGTAQETNTVNTDTVCLGKGLIECVRMAVAGLQLPEKAVEGVIGDINGERYRAEEWGFVSLALPEAMIDPTDYDMPATFWGDMGAASGPLFLAIAVTAGQRGWAKGKRYLIWNSSECGQRAAVVLELNMPRNGAE